MKPFSIALIAGLAIASNALAHQGVKDPNVKAWMHAMGLAGKSSKELGEMAKGTTPYSAETANAAKDQLIAVSESFATLFATKADDPVSEARAGIWENYEDFRAKAAAMTSAAADLDIRSAESIGQGLRALGKTCRSCHRDYRE